MRIQPWNMQCVRLRCNSKIFVCLVLQQHNKLQHQLAASETHSSELEAHEQELLSQLSSREAELLSVNSRLSEQQAAQEDTQRQLQTVRHEFVQYTAIVC